MKTTDSLAAVIAWLDAQVDWPSTYGLYGVELPAGWQPSATALLLSDSGLRDPDLPVITATIAAWCYGTTMEQARDVADVLCGIVHRCGVANVTVSSKSVYVGPGLITTEPIYLREPETYWHRWIVRFTMKISEFPR